MSFGKSLGSELGRNTGKWISNKVFGNTGWATPKRLIIEGETIKIQREDARLYKQREREQDRIDKQEEEERVAKNKKDAIEKNTREVNEINNYLEVIQSLHKSYSEKMNWKEICDAKPPSYVQTAEEANHSITDTFNKDFTKTKNKIEIERNETQEELTELVSGKFIPNEKSFLGNYFRDGGGGCSLLFLKSFLILMFFYGFFFSAGNGKVTIISTSFVFYLAILAIQSGGKKMDKKILLEKKLKKLNNQIENLEKERQLQLQKKLDEQNQAHERYQQDVVSYNNMMEIASGVINKECQAYEYALRFFNPFEDLELYGSEILFNVNENIAMVEFYPNCENVVPKSIKKLLKKGAHITEVEIPRSRFNLIYQDYVCSSVLKIAKEIFQLLPDVVEVYLNTNTSTLNKTNGFNEEQTILTIKITRPTLENLNFELIDPSDSIVNFEHEINFKRTSGFGPVSALKFA